MEKQEFKSKWDELAEQIGAEVSSETQQREEAAANAAREASVTPPAEPVASTIRSPLPKRVAVDWDNLAGELGLPPAETAPPSFQAAESEPPRKEPLTQQMDRPPRERQPRRERSDRPRESPREWRAPAAKRSEPDDVLPGQSTDPTYVRHVETPTPSLKPGEEPDKPSAAVSLWHKIFGSPTEQTAKLSDISSGEIEEREAVEARDDGASMGDSTEIRSLSGEDVTAARYVDELDRDKRSEMIVDNETSTEQRRGRSRRRRRGRGRRSEQRPTEERAPRRDRDRPARTDDDSDIDEDFRDIELGKDQIATGEFQDGVEDESIAEDSEDGAPSSNRSKAAQRSIPSWDEAIGFIVDSNMQSRSQRRATSRAEARCGSSRGRSRGRRKS
jgi:hypothetical protein